MREIIKTKEKIVDLKDYGFLVDLSELEKYSASRTILLNKTAVEALVKAKNTLPPGCNFQIKDGLRTLAVQRKIVEIHEKQFREEYPDNWLELLNKYTGGYAELKLKKISFMNHRSGFAVDLTLVKNDKELDMGGVSLDEKDSLDFFENKKPLSPKERNVRDNRRLLKKAMLAAGFRPHLPEWWHWGYQLRR